MAGTAINDLTDAFDIRLKALQAARAPGTEQDAAITVYERVRTARSILQALSPSAFSAGDLVALASELGKAAQAGQGPITDE